MRAKQTIFGVLLVLGTICAEGQTLYLDGVLSQSSDMTGCEAKPKPIPHVTRGGVRSVVSPEEGPGDGGCSDLGSIYQIVAGGRLYGLKRTEADVKRDAALLTQGSTASLGVLGFQPTGLHVLVSPVGNIMRVKLKQRQGAYSILYTR